MMMTEDIDLHANQEYLLLNWTVTVASDQFFQNETTIRVLMSLKALTVIRTLSELAKQGYACRS